MLPTITFLRRQGTTNRDRLSGHCAAATDSHHFHHYFIACVNTILIIWVLHIFSYTFLIEAATTSGSNKRSSASLS